MATFQELLNKVSTFSQRTGLFSITKSEFFLFLTDVVNKIKESYDRMNSVAKQLIWQNEVNTFADLATTYPTPQSGWAAIVKSEGVIYAYDGAAWKNTGLTAFPDDVLLKGGFEGTAADLAVKGNTTKTLAEVEDLAVSADEVANDLSDAVDTSKDAEFAIKDLNGNVVMRVDDEGVKANLYNICNAEGTIIFAIDAEFIESLLATPVISLIDNLNSDSTTEAVTAKQSKLLKSLIDLLNSIIETANDTEFSIKDGVGNFVLKIDTAGLKVAKISFCDATGDVLGYITAEVVAKINSLTAEIDYTPIGIPYLFYMVNPALYSREYPVRVFPESFLDFKPTVPVTTNYRRDASLSRQKKTTTAFETITKSIVLRGSGYKEKTLSVNLHCLNETLLSGKNIRLLMFGVSFDAINYRSADGSSEPGGTMTSNLIEKLFYMGEIDTSATRHFVSLGTMKYNANFTYNGNTKLIYGCSEARGGNGGVNYLRQPMHFSPADVSYDPNVSGTSATGLIMWLMNGLRYRIPYNEAYSESGTDYGIYERTAAKTDALRCTPFGKYHHDYALELWDFCNQKGWIIAVGGTYSSWSNSSEQRAIIDQCMDYIANNPEYPWYSRDKARETSFSSGVAKSVTDNTQHSIDMSVYFSRYRTMDDLGVRLVNGASNPAGLTATGSDGLAYTIGSKITSQSLLTTINICKPTHVIWDMAYNDWPFYVSNTGQSSGSDSLALSQLFISAIQAQLGAGVKIGLKAKKDNGSFYPETWGDVALAQGYNASGHLVNYNKLLISNYFDLSQQVNWIPIFPVSIPFASNFLQQQEDFIYGKTLVNSGESYSATSDVTHEGLASAKAMALQIYGWLAYSVK